MKPTSEEITTEIAKLREMKPNVRHYSMFGDNNWMAVEAQIEVLEDEMTSDDIYGRWPEEYEEIYFRDVALEALAWMNDDEDAEVPSDSWKSWPIEPEPPVVVGTKMKKSKKAIKKVSKKAKRK